MSSLYFDVAHLLAGSLVLVSFLLLYQDRLYALLNAFALHAVILALSVAWQAHVQGAPHLYITAAIALVFKAIVIPVALHRIIQRLGIHRDIETVIGSGTTMLASVPYNSMWPWRCLGTSKLMAMLTTAPFTNSSVPATWVATSTGTLVPLSGSLVISRSGRTRAVAPDTRATGPIRLTSAVM